jgi:predicted transposase/invertase (TIGR01784 family)
MAANLSQSRSKRAKKIGIEKGLKEGISIGSHTKAIEAARNFLRMGFPAEKIAEATGLSLSEIQNLE